MCVCVCVFVELSCTLDWITSGSPASPLSLLCVGSAKRRIFETNICQNVQNTLVVPLHFAHPLLLSPLPPPRLFVALRNYLQDVAKNEIRGRGPAASIQLYGRRVRRGRTFLIRIAESRALQVD